MLIYLDISVKNVELTLKVKQKYIMNFIINDLLCKVHTLFDKRYAGPTSVSNKTCGCNLNNVMRYKHNDGGILYVGERNGLKIIVCDKCYEIFDYYNFVFSCPLYGKNF